MKALEHLRALVEFAYANGYHELGYDPIKEIEERLYFYALDIKAAEAAQMTLHRHIERQTQIIESCCSAPLIGGVCSVAKDMRERIDNLCATLESSGKGHAAKDEALRKLEACRGEQLKVIAAACDDLGTQGVELGNMRVALGVCRQAMFAALQDFDAIGIESSPTKYALVAALNSTTEPVTSTAEDFNRFDPALGAPNVAIGLHEFNADVNELSECQHCGWPKDHPRHAVKAATPC
jgi:hypothetical protein